MGGVFSDGSERYSKSEDQPNDAFDKITLTDKLVIDKLPFRSLESLSVCIGIGKQKYSIGRNANLGPPADNDAISMSEMLNKKFCIPLKNQKLLTCNGSSGLPTKASIISSLKSCARNCGKNGLLIFSFSGHNWYNINVINSTPVLIPFDFDGTIKSGITSTDLRKCIRKTKAKGLILILDCCYSGKIARDFLLETKSQKTSVFVIASCTSSQRALSYRELGHGLFTYFALKYIKSSTDECSDTFPLQNLLNFCHPLFKAINKITSPTLESDCLMTPEVLSNLPSQDVVDGAVSSDALVFIKKYMWPYLGTNEGKWMTTSDIPLPAVGWLWSSRESLLTLWRNGILKKTAEDQNFYTTVIISEMRSVCQVLYEIDISVIFQVEIFLLSFLTLAQILSHNIHEDLVPDGKDLESALIAFIFKASVLAGVSFKTIGPMDGLITLLQKITATQAAAKQSTLDYVDGETLTPKEQVLELINAHANAMAEITLFDE